MEIQKQNEEKLREACCYGDNEAVIALVTRGANINSKHDINGWTGLHWAAKRGNLETVRWLLANGADPKLTNNQSQTPADLSNDLNILQLLGTNSTNSAEGTAPNSESLPITPNYMAHPPPIKQAVHSTNSPPSKPLTNGITEVNGYPGTGSLPSNSNPSMSSCVPRQGMGSSSAQDFSQKQPKELVLKVRIANTDDPDFIEIDFPVTHMNFSHLLTTCCKELAVNPQLVERIRKLPNTRLRNDKDVKRLENFTELELVIKGQNRPAISRSDSHSTSKNSYQSISSFKNQTILY
ncbi:ankyrin repeat domain-containing protein 40-like [Penaeus japonicus]|uniref:ankyrin repeat domain-containing protein 40-like n=1 Tax=Penaeus japonicus TaxID=27405 RepID=UPI001C710583|nr:ankyrin repeat domain-containing protein 40-like [Penaeus japonicus]XP_042876385.1 ankyrin repeat domain-containing protein 40-like [Penaeus japonicus]XP_042876386.1 ankyrin repeat domain-containing protein 40-like [Penaeus japonicus]XP_042876388.1 ankyrin repeat domain-containing protein 40-like [Penaeus japonicus]